LKFIEASQHLQESAGLKLEWEHYCKLEGLVSKIREREAYRDGTDNKILNNSNNGLNSNSSSSEKEGSTVNVDDTAKQFMIDDIQRRKDKFVYFLDWLSQNGVDIDKVEICFKDQVEGFGLKTKVPLNAGDVVFTIPKKTIITSTVARESKLSM
jgi:hypothetical protein